MRLYINVDHVATVREARKTDEPKPLDAALLCERAGADGITVHLREDRRHIQDSDVRALATAVQTVLNLELAAVDGMVDIALDVRPHQATLVPEKREEITTEGGLDLREGSPAYARVSRSVERLRERSIRVSLFIDPTRDTIERAAQTGAPAIELHTGEYANTWRESGQALDQLAEAVEHARSLGLAVHAGHGLTYANVQPVARIPGIEELNIGHSIVSRSILVGMEAAVGEMRSLIDTAR